MVKSDHTEKVVDVRLKKLKRLQVQKIDELLTKIGKYGEVRLIVQNGKLRYINKLVSYSVSDNSSSDQAS